MNLTNVILTLTNVRKKEDDMGEENIKDRIILEAVRLFAQKGYHGTSMRDIAAAVGCSLPMFYYYFKNKQDLFEEIVVGEFNRMHERINKSLSFTGDLPAFYKAFLKSRKTLTPYEKSLYRLSYKTISGFEDIPKLVEEKREWERTRELFNKKLIAKYCGASAKSEILSSIFYRLIENVSTKLIIQEIDIDDAQIDKEVDLIFDLICGCKNDDCADC